MPGFLDLPLDYTSYDTASYAVLPVAYDGTSTWIKGADRGPSALLAASAQVELYDIETQREVFTCGIYTHPELSGFDSPERCVSAVRTQVSRFLSDGLVPVTLGGEHSVAIGAIQAAAELHTDLTVVQLDAHGDLRHSYEGSVYNHACVAARIKECCSLVQAGIRSMSSEELSSFDPERTVFAAEMQQNTVWIDKIVSLCSEDVYISFDLDVLDPSIMPSTGTPEPGGIGWYAALELLARLCRTSNIVGFDIVELCPNGNHAAEFLAAKLVYKIINYREAGKK